MQTSEMSDWGIGRPPHRPPPAPRSVLVTNDHPGTGPSVHRAPPRRLGGAWLALLTSGYALRLNTPSEVATILEEPDE